MDDVVPVRDGRELRSKEASAAWTGAVWLAGEAKGLGLVDQVEPLDATVERLTASLRARAAKVLVPGLPHRAQDEVYHMRLNLRRRGGPGTRSARDASAGSGAGG